MVAKRFKHGFWGCVFGSLLISGWSGAAFGELNLNPIDKAVWTKEQAAHLASRAGFGANRVEIEALSHLSPHQAVRRFIQGLDIQHLPAFDHSGVFDEGLDPFPASRPATTALAKRQGHALGVQVKPSGNRPLQPVSTSSFTGCEPVAWKQTA